MAQGADFAEVFVEERHSTAVVCEDDRIEKVTTGREVGIGLRVLVGESTAYGYANELSPEALLGLARTVAEAAKLRGGGSAVVNLRRTPVPYELTVLRPPAEAAVSDRVALVQRANATARREDPRIKQVMVNYADTLQRVWIANSEGDYVEDERVRVRLAVHAVAVAGGLLQTGYEAVGGFSGLELFERQPPEEVARTAARRSLLMLEARPAPTGRMPVVMAAEAGGTMVHEACGHGLEADLVQKGLSVYAGRLGQPVASPLVTVVDDATLEGRFGSYRFDDEGTPGQKTVLIEKGVLCGYMYDRLTARREGRPSTGNGRRESYQYRPLPRMRNTYIAPGEHDPEEIIRRTQRGLLVKKMGGGQVNTTNGDFVFEVAEGYLIEQGRVTAPVRGATLTGNGPEVLRQVDMVGGDLGFSIGVCGKNGQGVPVSDAQPTLRIPSLVVGGTAGAGEAEAATGGPRDSLSGLCRSGGGR
ncbi:MAG: TldD/PmbA family protein [Clostridia bacterium]|jgi:TldD protein|nr:TldD/PmbA family protein [Clostridia bacterium]MDH7572644.1 TldD/PmbA family protein [Clostridia bacterium]